MYFTNTQISNAAKTPLRVVDAILSRRWLSREQVPSRASLSPRGCLSTRLHAVLVPRVPECIPTPRRAEIRMRDLCSIAGFREGWWNVYKEVRRGKAWSVPYYYFRASFVALCATIFLSQPIQAAPITLAQDPLSDFLRKIALTDPSFASQALERILDSFSFLSEINDQTVADTEEELKKLAESAAAELEKDLEKAIKEMLDDNIKELLKENPPIIVDVKALLDLELIDPRDLVNEVKVGSFPKKFKHKKPIKLTLKTPVPNSIEFSLLDPLSLVDSRDIEVFRLKSANISVFKVPLPSTLALLCAGFFGYMLSRIRKQEK